MKFLIVSLLAVSVVNGISVRGFANTNAVRITYARNDPKCTAMGPQCADDCRTLLFCSSFSSKPLSIMTCPATTPHCFNGACTSTAGLCKTGPGGSTFKCTDEGIFPDPSDCTRFHICEADSTAEDYQCDTGFVFNSILKSCQMGKTPCTKISCSRASEANTFIAYASNPTYYAFCMNDNGVFSTLMFKCLYDKFEEFDAKAKQCQFKCKAKGTFQNPADCGESFSCSGVNAKPVTAKCPAGWVFDGTSCNRDADTCVHKPKGSDGFSAPEPVDGAAEILFNKLKNAIHDKICALDNDPTKCKADTTITADQYREKSADEVNTYLVSVTLTKTNPSTTEVYHVKLISDLSDAQAPIEEVDKIDGPKSVGEELKPF
ncbi:uncharacterized protein LOC119072817 [Bradysia coprophila]|uniref:uncharacterized protein LOC119072817 n=1 Tax=Bradysia coprophila TaxID=38358 RepID=UPI00187DC42B|nr:uncharacterized protein LOC119072817 [Bradysia coprophila]